jgi:acyl carrier protein
MVGNSMNLNDFVKQFAEQFEEIDGSKFNGDMRFRDMDEWDSMHALSVIAMVDAEYNVTITGDDIRNSQTVEDIYNIVKSRIK